MNHKTEPDQNRQNPSDKNLLIRLNKALAHAGVCSRRKADELIMQGLVKINGKPVETAGTKINPAIDRVTVMGKKVEIQSLQEPKKLTYIIVNKPIQVVSTCSDPQGRDTILDLLPEQIRSKRIYPVGRLDFFSEGLLLLTDDGELTMRLTHPKYKHPKRYKLQVRGEVTPQTLETMRSGMTLSEGKKLAPVQVEVLRRGTEKTTLELTLHQGVNRQIRRMCQDLDLQILRLVRTSIACLNLGKMESGAWRNLTETEISELRTTAKLA